MKLTPSLSPEERSELINRDLSTRDDVVAWMKQLKAVGLDFPVEHGSSEMTYTFGPDEVQEMRNQFSRIDQIYQGEGYQALIDGGWEIDPNDNGDTREDRDVQEAADTLIPSPDLLSPSFRTHLNASREYTLSPSFRNHLDARFGRRSVAEAVSVPDEQANSRRPLANQTMKIYQDLRAAGWKTVTTWSQSDGTASLLRGPDGSAFEVTVRPAAAAQHSEIKRETGAGAGWARPRYQANKRTARRPSLPGETGPDALPGA